MKFAPVQVVSNVSAAVRIITLVIFQVKVPVVVAATVTAVTFSPFNLSLTVCDPVASTAAVNDTLTKYLPVCGAVNNFVVVLKSDPMSKLSDVYGITDPEDITAELGIYALNPTAGGTAAICASVYTAAAVIASISA